MFKNLSGLSISLCVLSCIRVGPIKGVCFFGYRFVKILLSCVIWMVKITINISTNVTSKLIWILFILYKRNKISLLFDNVIHMYVYKVYISLVYLLHLYIMTSFNNLMIWPHYYFLKRYRSFRNCIFMFVNYNHWSVLIVCKVFKWLVTLF